MAFRPSSFPPGEWRPESDLPKDSPYPGPRGPEPRSPYPKPPEARVQARLISEPILGPTEVKLEPAPQPPPPKRKRFFSRFLGFLIVAAALFAAGYGVATWQDSGAEDAAQPISTATTVAPSPPSTVTPPATTPAPEIVGPVDELAMEPIAAVASAVGPSVVQLQSSTGTGSGVIYDAAGYILTAAHVVEGNQTVTVKLADGRIEDGTVLGTHDTSDVAVIKVDDIGGLPVATLALGIEPQVGQTAIALGFPFGLDQTVTAGIVSAVNRTVNNVAMVQTDAAINPGNSGGPLLDRTGRVIGINDVIFTQGGGNDGVGFAIAIDVAKVVADQIVAGEDPQLAFLGVSTIENTDGQGGASVQNVVEDSAAAASGLAVGDIIVSVDGEPVIDGSELRARIISKKPGTTVTIGVIRDGRELFLAATLGGTD